MATTTGTYSGIASTITVLEAELPQLEDQQRELEKTLADVTQRLDVVRTALTSLKALAGAPAPLTRQADLLSEEMLDVAPTTQPLPAIEETTLSSEPEAVPAPRRASDAKVRRGVKSSTVAAGRKAARETAKPKQREGRASRKATAAAKPAKAAPAKRTRTPGLSKSIVAVLAKSKKPLRAGEVNEVLGRENTNGSVNSVRTALERLVANRDIQRVGRGLYREA
ncbi:hypothetical protein ABZ746_38890 [Streptomyces sp. NPDC020096]